MLEAGAEPLKICAYSPWHTLAQSGDDLSNPMCGLESLVHGLSTEYESISKVLRSVGNKTATEQKRTPAQVLSWLVFPPVLSQRLASQAELDNFQVHIQRYTTVVQH